MPPIRIRTPKLVGVLFAILAFLLAMHLVVTAMHWVFHQPVAALTELFDMDQESNLPAAYNMVLFLMGAIGFFLCGRNVTAPRTRRTWYLMAGIFVFLAMDEGAQLHEKFMLTTLRLLNDGGLGDGRMGWFYYAWTIPYGIAVLGLLAHLVPWLARLDPSTRLGLLTSGGTFLFGAVFMEAWSGKVAEALGAAARSDAELPWLPCFVYNANTCFQYDDPAYVAISTIEEVAEMSGLILCIGTLVRALERQGARVEIAFAER